MPTLRKDGSAWVDMGKNVLNRTVDISEVDKVTIFVQIRPNGAGGAYLSDIVLK